MTNHSRSTFAGRAIAAVATLVILSQGCAHSDQQVTPATGPSASTQAVTVGTTAPDELALSGPVLLTVHAHGFQIYSRPSKAGDDVPWKLKAPDAEFTSDDGVKGKHYAGPTWETADGTKVVGAKVAEQASPDPGSAPWLLLKVVSHEGNGPIGTATYIKRINTTGGKLAEDYPKVGDETHVPYTADYVFYGPGATNRP